MRTIELRFDQDPKGVETDKFRLAIGYLSTWGMSYPKVVIFGDGEADILANYYKEDGSIGYQIGAIWRDGRYEFHS